jgi:hypothetical protein
VPDPDLFRERARRCRELLKLAVNPEVVEQLKAWARDFDGNAIKLDRELAVARRALRHSMKRRRAQTIATEHPGERSRPRRSMERS